MVSQKFKEVGKMFKRISLGAVVAFPVAFQAIPARACGIADQVVSIAANGSEAVVTNASGNKEQISSPDEAFRRAYAAKQAALRSDDSCGTMTDDSIIYMNLYTQMDINAQQAVINSLRASMNEPPQAAPAPLPGMPTSTPAP